MCRLQDQTFTLRDPAEVAHTLRQATAYQTCTQQLLLLLLLLVLLLVLLLLLLLPMLVPFVLLVCWRNTPDCTTVPPISPTCPTQHWGFSPGLLSLPSTRAPVPQTRFTSTLTVSFATTAVTTCYVLDLAQQPPAQNIHHLRAQQTHKALRSTSTAIKWCRAPLAAPQMSTWHRSMPDQSKGTWHDVLHCVVCHLSSMHAGHNTTGTSWNTDGVDIPVIVTPPYNRPEVTCAGICGVILAATTIGGHIGICLRSHANVVRMLSVVIACALMSHAMHVFRVNSASGV
jgi:hypothetical protein